ncbi:prolyl oligopeptidase family serine peptidase [Micromonospora sediminimaris]|uniref:prolyl oligopeptidase family serine peptidase n=1 Tax=Micromonospora sediminimaris TaxID=547162 RepID=UPI0037BBC8A1
MREYSPYHNVRGGGPYPPVLLITSTRDDRVHPGHARKMAARLREHGHDVSYYENVEGGHGAAANNEQRVFVWALVLEFLSRKLAGPGGAAVLPRQSARPTKGSGFKPLQGSSPSILDVRGYVSGHLLW